MKDGGAAGRGGESSEEDSVNMGRHFDHSQIKSTRLRQKNFD